MPYDEWERFEEERNAIHQTGRAGQARRTGTGGNDQQARHGHHHIQASEASGDVVRFDSRPGTGSVAYHRGRQRTVR